VRRMVKVTGYWTVLLAALAALWPGVARGLTPSQVFEQVQDSVVVVQAFDRQGKQVGLGSGVVLPGGGVVTNHHVAAAGDRLKVGAKGRFVAAALLASDPTRDLALLSAPGLRATPATLGRAGSLKVGDRVYAVGAPYGLELSLSEGLVSQLRGGPPPLIQTTAAISPGSSGGGLFNDRGELVGITTFYLKEAQGLNFALPVEWLGSLAGKTLRAAPPAPAPAVPAPRPGTAGNWGDRAVALENAQDWDGLLAHCRRWTHAEPDNAFPWAFLAHAHHELGHYREAIKAYREALRLKPDFANAWYNLGLAYKKSGRYREAIEAYREALRLKPDGAEAWYNLGFAYGESGRYREAIEAYREALRLKPDDAKAWYNLGVAYGKSGRYQEEIEAYREALRLKPDDAKAWYNLGFAYGESGRHREAIEAYREALRLKPDDANAWNNLAITYALSGNRSAALQAVKELRRYDPQQAEKLFNLIMKP
jgi:tetratricopeptide (TPR) repeat protein